MDHAVDVVIRTAGRPERRSALQRAIRSVFAQQGVVVRPIVVIAGDLPRLAAELGQLDGVKVHLVGEPASPGRALAIGRRLVEADFYAFLDDDDELLPHALGTGLRILRANPAVDLTVTTGYRISEGERRIHIPDIARHQNDALNGIIDRCWLSACGGLYRSNAIPRFYFECLPDLCEWTCLAFRLAMDHRNIRFLDFATYVLHEMPESQSKSARFLEATLDVLAAMRAHPLPRITRARLEQKYRAALHQAADHYRRTRDLRKAWRFHLRSLKPPYTLHYAAYTRKLVWGTRAANP